MSKIWGQTFGVSTDDKDRDERYVRLSHALSIIDLETLMGESLVPDETLLGEAQTQLLKMDKYKAPRDKLLCLINVKTLIEQIIENAVKNGAHIGGADAFFPILVLVVIKAQPPSLSSNIEYIRRFRGQRVSGQFDFMLSNLESVAVYLDTVDWKDLKVSEDEFLARLSNAGIPEADLQLRAKKIDLSWETPGDGAVVKERENVGNEVPDIDEGAQNSVPHHNQEIEADNKPISEPYSSLLLPSSIPTSMGVPDVPANQSDPEALSLAQQDSKPRREFNTIKSLIEEGTPLVLHEESEGRLEQKYPCMYADAKDLSTVRMLTIP